MICPVFQEGKVSHDVDCGLQRENRQGGQLRIGTINTLNQGKEATSWKAEFILDLNKLLHLVDGLL